MQYTPMKNILLTLCVTKVQASPSSRIEERDVGADVEKVALRLMPLGASITYGEHSSTGNGYRKDLRDLLVSEEYEVDMVGSRKHGDFDDNEVEGWSGYRIEQVEGKAKLSVPSRLPNIFTVNAGTNDCSQNYKISEAGKRTSDLLEYLWSASPNSTVILSTLLLNLNTDTETRVLDVNKQIKATAQQKQSEKKRVVLVDMHASDGPHKDDMADDTHPNDVGYNKMAKVWLKGIQEAARKGFLHEPQPLIECAW